MSVTSDTKYARTVSEARTAGAGASPPSRMKTLASAALTPREKQARALRSYRSDRHPRPLLLRIRGHGPQRRHQGRGIFELGPIPEALGAAGVIGGLIGALAAGRISDKIGRKTTLCIAVPSCF